MGACTFTTYALGKNPTEAFNNVVREARFEHGHGGYTGTIAEKHSFVVVPVRFDAALPVKERQAAAFKVAQEMIDAGDRRIDDKWGDAGCIDIGPANIPGEKLFLFFGWASE